MDSFFGSLPMPGQKGGATPPESAPRRPRRRTGQPFGPRWPGVGAGYSLVVLAVGTVRVRQRDAVRAARSPGNPRERLPGVRARGSAGAGRDRAGSGTGSATTSGRLPDQSRGGRVRRGSGPACVIPGQLNGIHPTSRHASRHASPARRNPSALDPRDPTWHNASPGDITKSTPPGVGLRHGVPGPGPRPRLPRDGTRRGRCDRHDRGRPDPILPEPRRRPPRRRHTYELLYTRSP